MLFMHYVLHLSGDAFGLKTFSGAHGVIKSLDIP